MLIFYTQPDVIDEKTGLVMLPPPSWLTVDLGSRTLKIQTTD
jgi:hypothetical protein